MEDFYRNGSHCTEMGVTYTNNSSPNENTQQTYSKNSFLTLFIKEDFFEIEYEFKVDVWKTEMTRKGLLQWKISQIE